MSWQAKWQAEWLNMMWPEGKQLWLYGCRLYGLKFVHVYELASRMAKNEAICIQRAFVLCDVAR